MWFFVVCFLFLVKHISMMKNNLKSLLILGLCITIGSCSKNDLKPGDTGYVKNHENFASGGDGKWDLLGYGYDVTGPLMENDNASDAPIIDMNRFVADHLNKIDAPTNSSAEQNSYSGATAFDYLREVTRKRSGGIEIVPGEGNSGKDDKPLFSGSLSKDNNSIYSFSSKYSFASYEHMLRIKRIRFTGDASNNLLMQYLTPDFLNNVANYTAEQLVKRYGTHVLLDVSLGGRLTYNYKGSIITVNEANQKSLGIKAGLSFGLKKIGINLNFGMTNEEITKTTNETRNRTYSLKFSGGTNSGRTISIDKDGNTSESINVASWEQSVNANNCALVDIGKSVLLYELIADPIKKAQVKTAVEKHISDSQVEVQELYPLYAVKSHGDKNNMYVTSISAVNELVYGYGNEYQGLVGYVIAKPGSSTTPLHYMKSNGDKNNFFLTSMAAVNEHIIRWGNIHYGIVGYVLQNPNSDTLPFYQVKSDGDKNTMYVTSQSAVDELVYRWGNRFEGTVGYIVKP